MIVVFSGDWLMVDGFELFVILLCWICCGWWVCAIWFANVVAGVLWFGCFAVCWVIVCCVGV